MEDFFHVGIVIQSIESNLGILGRGDQPSIGDAEEEVDVNMLLVLDKLSD
jgi:hypothetical protein